MDSLDNLMLLLHPWHMCIFPAIKQINNGYEPLPKPCLLASAGGAGQIPFNDWYPKVKYGLGFKGNVCSAE